MPSRTRVRRTARNKTLLSSRDFTAYLRDKADQLAPADLQTLLSQSETAHDRAEKERETHPRLRRHVELSLRLLADHADGQCPQIPYHTVSLLAVAVLYFIDPLDVIPDWIPGVGTSDDALMFELAFAVGRPGIERYCAFKSIPTDGLLPAPRVARSRPARRTAPKKKKR